MTEYADLTGFFDRSQVSRLEMKGADRVRFLNGRLTCDVAPLAVGEGVYGFLTQIKGRILADVKVLARAESLWLELPPGKGEEIAAHLGKYILTEDVEIRSLDQVPISLVGSRAVAIADVEAADKTPDAALPAATLAHRPGRVLGVEVLVVREAYTGPSSSPVPVQTLWVAPGEATSLREQLVERGIPALAVETWQQLRVEAGYPLHGQDYGEDNFPQETGLEDAVSYTKGCYLGQEVVARIHYRGGVNKLLRGLYFDGEIDPTGKAVFEGERRAGTVTSAAASPSLGQIGLAILHKRVEPGAQVELEGGGKAIVTALPFTGRPAKP